ncbi:hypothetical protein RHGRI_003647 [Rhododendron griersonianum]|uniref:Uncharacterized protein n=1 Tax=Rhododendron griersonianum TaxID=479676 RepID=A0AAV6L7K2_9ERIC|nr:hypothetical protein RHGRI_003647 [Rhododendron griersonianum]
MPTVKNHRHVKIQIRIGSWSWSETTVFAPAVQQRGEVVVSFFPLRTTGFACSLPASTSAPVQSEEKAKKRRRSSISRLLLLPEQNSVPFFSAASFRIGGEWSATIPFIIFDLHKPKPIALATSPA